MSNEAITAAYNSTCDDPTDAAVLLALADQANDDSVCWPSVASIAFRTRLSERTVQDALKRLQGVYPTTELARAKKRAAEKGGPELPPLARHITVRGNRLGGRPGSGATARYVIHPVPCAKRWAAWDARRKQAAAVADEERQQTEPLLPLPGTGAANAPVPEVQGESVRGAANAPVRGAANSRQGCGKQQTGVRQLHPNPHRTLKEPILPPGGVKKDFVPLIPEPCSEELRTALAGFVGMRRRRGWRFQPEEWAEFLASQVREYPEAAVIAALKFSTANGYKAIMPGNFLQGPASGQEPVLARKKISAAPEVQAGVVEIFRREHPEFRGEYRDIPVPERRRAQELFQAEQRKEDAA